MKKMERGEIYIFVFQMKEEVYLESLDGFCRVKTRPNPGLLLFFFSITVSLSGTLLHVIAL